MSEISYGSFGENFTTQGLLEGMALQLRCCSVVLTSSVFCGNLVTI